MVEQTIFFKIKLPTSICGFYDTERATTVVMSNKFNSY